jgi:hypothetical protein
MVEGGAARACLPSAMFDGTETAARRIWLLNPYLSDAGNSDVTSYVFTTASIDICHASKSR